MSQDLDAERFGDFMEGGEEKDHVAQALGDAMENLDNPEVIKMFTHLDEEEIKILSVLMTIDSDLINQFGQEYMEQKVSYKRKGRGEIVESFEAFANIYASDEESRLGKMRDKIGL